jgi:formylglycine-generating enzyme required for sulfatase activity
MGDNFNEGSADQHPVHTVYLDEFYISRYEITFSQYNFFLRETGWPIPDNLAISNGEYPVYNVTWMDANAFCEWLSEKIGENVKLPTEAQWEKAARGTDQRKYPWGNSEPNCQLGNFNPCGAAPKAVGSAPDGRSPYGVEDMAGNVAEWCRDWYESTYYNNSPYSNPQGPGSGLKRVFRGSSYLSILSHGPALYSTFRSSKLPDQRSTTIGFRVVKE